MNDPQLQRVAGGAATILGRLTRFGFAVKGLVTVLVGVLALRYALGRGGDVTGQEGAIHAVLEAPFGRAMLTVIGAGLVAYALWMFIAAYADPEGKGTGFAGIAERMGFFATGVGYALLALGAVELLLGRDDGGGMGLDAIAATLLTPTVGRLFVGLVGIIVMIAGILQLRLGLTGKFRESLRSGLSKAARIVTTVTGSLGYVTLGVMSLMVGYSLVQVAVEYDPSEAAGWDASLWLLAGLGEGRTLLAIVAAGLVCYGLYFVVLMRYRRL